MQRKFIVVDYSISSPRYKQNQRIERDLRECILSSLLSNDNIDRKSIKIEVKKRGENSSK